MRWWPVAERADTSPASVSQRAGASALQCHRRLSTAKCSRCTYDTRSARRKTAGQAAGGVCTHTTAAAPRGVGVCWSWWHLHSSTPACQLLM